MDTTNKCTDILFLIRRITKLQDCHFNKKLESLGLTAQQGRILLFVGGMTYFKKKDVRQKDIEEMLELSKSTVSGLIDRLEDKDLIKRISQSNSCNLVLTDKAVKLLEELDRNRLEQRAIVLDGLSIEEKEQLVKLLNKIINNMKGEEKC